MRSGLSKATEVEDDVEAAAVEAVRVLGRDCSLLLALVASSLLLDPDLLSLLPLLSLTVMLAAGTEEVVCSPLLLTLRTKMETDVPPLLEEEPAALEDEGPDADAAAAAGEPAEEEAAVAVATGEW